MGYVRLTRLGGRALQLGRLGGQAMRLGMIRGPSDADRQARGPKNCEKFKFFTLILRTKKSCRGSLRVHRGSPDFLHLGGRGEGHQIFNYDITGLSPSDI